MKPTPPRQGRNVSFTNINQATRSTAANKPGREQSTTSSKASVPNVCVAGHHHATLCHVDLHGVVTSRVLREQRKGPLHLSIGPAMVVRKDFKRRRGNTM